MRKRKRQFFSFHNNVGNELENFYDRNLDILAIILVVCICLGTCIFKRNILFKIKTLKYLYV